MADYLDQLDANRVQVAVERIQRSRPELIAQAGGNVRLALYLLLVDHELRRQYGVMHRDLADFAWADGFADGVSPADAASAALQSDGLFI